ncbi:MULTISPECIES: plasmid stabilization protein [unclassified Nocardia]|uniref:plasmid stabilization protein n=1 Tax=unclassified Nocardia TaxID=2637762 RepID=UPI00278C3517|nr:MULTISPECIES: plasmid stabilization protein [unclassified Nocardia]
MPKEWTDKQERQYEHIRKSERDQGASAQRAKEIAARTVNADRARSGQTKSSGGSRSRSRGRGSSGPTRDQLYEEAKKRDIHGRSRMTKAQLAKALGRD